MNVGVIGVGAMGKNHARVLSNIANLVGIADQDIATAKEIAEWLGTTPYQDYKELLDSDVDAVVIATPTKTHFDVGMEAINRGKHVLMEKPLCSTMDDSKKLVQAAKDAGVTFGVGLIERHNPVVAFAKKGLEGGAFGEPVSLSSRRVSSFPARIRDVGVVLDIGIHDIDVMRYLAGSDAVAVYAIGGKKNNESYEDYANIMIEFANGVSGVVEINWLTPMKVRRLNLTCTGNYVEIDYMNQGVKVSSSQILTYDPANLYQIPIEYDIRNINLKKQEPLKNELIDFISAIENKKEPLVSGDEGIKTMEVALAAMESLATGLKISPE